MHYYKQLYCVSLKSVSKMHLINLLFHFGHFGHNYYIYIHIYMLCFLPNDLGIFIFFFTPLFSVHMAKSQQCVYSNRMLMNSSSEGT